MATRIKEPNITEVEDLQKLKKVRTIIKGQFTRAKKLSTNDLTCIEIEEKLSLIEDTWVRYKEVQKQIDEVVDEENLENEIEYRCIMESDYLKIKVEMKNALHEVQPLPSRISTDEQLQIEASTNRTIHSTNLNFTPYQIDESFSNFIKRLEVFLILRNQELDDKTKIYTLVHSLTPFIHQQLYDICAPENPLDKTYEELIKLLSDHLDPKPSVWALQHKFNSRMQQPDESVTELSVALKKMSVDCSFNCACGKSVSDMFLSLQFIRGLKDNDIRTKLLQETNQHTYKDIVQTASCLIQYSV